MSCAKDNFDDDDAALRRVKWMVGVKAAVI